MKKFRSIYSKTIAILTSMSLTLFTILMLINTRLLRNELIKVWVNIERPRIMRLFETLDRNFNKNTDPQTLHEELEKIQFRFNLELFDRSGNWITGSYSNVAAY